MALDSIRRAPSLSILSSRPLIDSMGTSPVLYCSTRRFSARVPSRPCILSLRSLASMDHGIFRALTRGSEFFRFV
jgi:hypothetical protein